MKKCTQKLFESHFYFQIVPNKQDTMLYPFHLILEHLKLVI